VSETGATLSVTDIQKSYGDLHVLKGVSLDVARGEVVTLIGSSGSGKSTFLRCMNLLEIPQSGALSTGPHRFTFGNGERTPRDAELALLRRDVGMVFQHFNLFPHMTVLANVAEGPIEVRGTPKAEAHELARDLLAKVGLADKADAYPARLSGGQKQRVAIARALAMKPDVMLFDEVTSALDPELVAEVLNVIRALAADGMTMILVTHEMAFAADVSHRVGFMSEGVMAEIGSANEVIHHPQHPRLISFLERFRQTSGS
jgi:polar amino acid transport system ATP-binding protein